MEPVKLAIFDFDGTLIKGDSIISYILLAKRLKAMTAPHFLGILLRAPLWAMHILSDSQYKSFALKFYASLPREKQLALDKTFVDEVLLPRIYKMGRAALDARKQEGYHVLLLSASTENYMQHVAAALNTDGLICTRLDEGDSKSDLPVLQLVGSPIIVNGKHRLIKAAPTLPRVHWQ